MIAAKTGDLHIKKSELPPPGESIVLSVGSYEVLVENTAPPGEEPTLPTNVGDVVGYVPVEMKLPGAQVQHAAAIYQREARTRVDRFTLCSATNSREVRRRLDRTPITHVTCAQCRAKLVAEGLLTN